MFDIYQFYILNVILFTKQGKRYFYSVYKDINYKNTLPTNQKCA